MKVNAERRWAENSRDGKRQGEGNHQDKEECSGEGVREEGRNDISSLDKIQSIEICPKLK